MERREYNGWTNYETWLMYLWYGDVFADMQDHARQNPHRRLRALDAEYIQSFVEEMLESDGALPQYGFAADIMNAFLREVDWQDLAEHYAVEKEDEEVD